MRMKNRYNYQILYRYIILDSSLPRRAFLIESQPKHKEAMKNGGVSGVTYTLNQDYQMHAYRSSGIFVRGDSWGVVILALSVNNFKNLTLVINHESCLS